MSGAVGCQSLPLMANIKRDVIEIPNDENSTEPSTGTPDATTGSVSTQADKPVVTAPNINQSSKKRSLPAEDSAGDPTAPPVGPTPCKVPRTSKLDPEASPLQFLNTIRPNLNFEVSLAGGTPHEPKFSACVVVDEKRYCGIGRSKQIAKQMTALEALKVILNRPQLIYKDSVAFVPQLFIPAGVEPSVPPISVAKIIEEAKPKDTANNNNFNVTPSDVQPVVIPPNKSPVQALNDMGVTAVYTLVEEDEKNLSKRFTMSVTVNGVTFRGYGTNKKLAKHAAARSALSAMSTPLKSDPAKLVNLMFDENLGDCIASAVIDKFEEFMASRPNRKPWKVLAGIVAVHPNGHLQVLTVTTGTKCIGGQNLSVTGSTVFDCHAEILSRRCFKYLMFDELEKCLRNKQTNKQNNSSTLLAFDEASGKYSLRNGIKLHLFISTSPCGDGRLFSPNEPSCLVADKNVNRASRGVLRTKIEGGEGTVRISPVCTIQTWDGIMSGDQRLLTHSCSDKVLRWNLLGLQGAILSNFINPIYITSIVLGSLLHPEHLSRAIAGRLLRPERSSVLPPGYRLNLPFFTKTNSVLERQISKSPSYAVAWIRDDTEPELLNTATGLLESGGISRVSKKMLLSRFQNYRIQRDGSAQSIAYVDAKELSFDYQAAKKVMLQEMELLNLGKWIKKPEECELFAVDGSRIN